MSDTKVKTDCIQPGLHHVVAPNGVMIGEIHKRKEGWRGYIYDGEGYGWSYGPTGNERLQKDGYWLAKPHRYMKAAASWVAMTAAYNSSER